MNRKTIRDMLSKVNESYRLELLYRAIDHLPEEHLTDIFGELMRYCDQDELAGPTPDVFEEVETFVEESERGAYYEDSDCLSLGKHCDGTNQWIALCCRLLDRLVDASATTPTQEVAEAFDSLFELLRHINHGDDTIVFFADEGGAWQVGVEWEDVVPAWSRCLATFEDPDTFASRTLELIDEFVRYQGDKLAQAAVEQLPVQYAETLMKAMTEKRSG